MEKKVKEKFFCNIFNVLAVLMFSVLFYYSLGLTGENRADLEDEYIYFVTEPVLLSAAWVGIALLILFYIGKCSDKLKNIKIRNALLGTVCFISGTISFLWIFFSKTAPQADQLLICNFARDFNQGDFSALQKGGYVAVYPQQLGMITLLRVLFAVFGEDNYMAFKCLSALVVPLLVFSGCKIVRHLSCNSVRAEIYYLLFIFFCFPMYAYTSFVYGDLISTGLGLFGVWMYLSCLKNFDWSKLLLFAVAMGVAVQLRENLLILVIAMGIVAAIKLIFSRSWENLALAAALFSGVLILHLSVQWIYHEVRPDDAEAIPASLFISMGLNDDYGRAGWYNDYHYGTFEELDYDLERAKEKGRIDLQIYLEIYMREPRRMVDFFTRKMNAQWNAPMYQCIVMNSRIVEEQPALIENIFHHGRAAQVIEFGMKIYQMLLYGSILFLLIVWKGNVADLERYALLIAVFGGFLFSLMWEAKTRYVLPYLLMQIPYMAMGVDRIISVLENRGTRRSGTKEGSSLC